MMMYYNKEFILAQWNTVQEVEQTIGVPFLCEIPIIKYLFSTTTRQKENCKLYLTIKPRLLNTAQPEKLESGKLFAMEK